MEFKVWNLGKKLCGTVPGKWNVNRGAFHELNIQYKILNGKFFSRIGGRVVSKTGFHCGGPARFPEGHGLSLLLVKTTLMGETGDLILFFL